MRYNSKFYDFLFPPSTDQQIASHFCVTVHEEKKKKGKTHRNLRVFYGGDFNVNLTRKITYLYVKNAFSSSLISFTPSSFFDAFSSLSIFNPHKKVQFICDLLPMSPLEREEMVVEAYKKQENKN